MFKDSAQSPEKDFDSSGAGVSRKLWATKYGWWESSFRSLQLQYLLSPALPRLCFPSPTEPALQVSVLWVAERASLLSAVELVHLITQQTTPVLILFMLFCLLNLKFLEKSHKFCRHPWFLARVTRDPACQYSVSSVLLPILTPKDSTVGC